MGNVIIRQIRIYIYKDRAALGTSMYRGLAALGM